jgi:hypothetical protein
MDKESTIISIRISRRLNDNLNKVAEELQLKKIDFIRFLLEAGTRLDKEKLKRNLQKVYEHNLEDGIRNLIEK